MYLCIYLLSFIVHFTQSSDNDYLEIKSGLEHVHPNSIALRFFITVNNTGEDCELECIPDRCCLEMEGGEDCGILEIIGGCVESIPKGESRTVRLAAPLVNPYERRGYCVVYLDSKPEGRGVFRNAVKIPFETTFSADSPTVVPCPEVDQDPFNDCKPVDCETYYNGQRPYYDKRLQRCVKLPPIETDADAVYDTKSNRFNRNSNVTNEDLIYIKDLINGEANRHAKDILIIKNKVPDSRREEVDEESVPSKFMAKETCNVSRSLPPLFNVMTKYFSKHADALIILVFLMTVQCCLVLTMVYCMSKGCHCNKDKTVISRFFNYRQDVSVTTPLISTGNIETETTCQFHSDSSMNVDKKIKCYKACHKDKMHNAKFSMSDDILSKCVNRRDWTHKPKSEVIHEFKTEEWRQYKGPKEVAYQKLTKNDTKASLDKIKVKKIESRVLFENDNFESESKPKQVKSIIKRNIDDLSTQPSSEKEIKCYSYEQAGSAVHHPVPVKTVSLSTEKGAQAYFSNDSIDDFLSERGMIFLAGENVSKYTFSTDSSYNMNMNMNKSSSEISGKTSKNNLVKNLISMIHRESKHGPSSDPGGGKKSSGNLDLELLHMSQASVFSSNASELVDGFKTNADSRSSL